MEDTKVGEQLRVNRVFALVQVKATAPDVTTTNQMSITITASNRRHSVRRNILRHKQNTTARSTVSDTFYSDTRMTARHRLDSRQQAESGEDVTALGVERVGLAEAEPHLEAVAGVARVEEAVVEQKLGVTPRPVVHVHLLQTAVAH